MNRRQAEILEQMEQANKNLPTGGIKMTKLKWAGVKYMTKSTLQKAFHTEEDIQKYLEANPQYTINQRFGHTKMINVEFYERAYAFTEVNHMGYRIPKRWLTDEEVEEYLKDPNATI
ncbi:hypothetical protein [Paenisporosarcina sp. NPDC076898]|uniref:hypothetical protein n=1 Tax=unclassified Paenisporosarcina TaxID=2642018 RepID=UPI003D026F44